MTKLLLTILIAMTLPVVAKEPKSKALKLQPSVLLDIINTSYNCGKLDGIAQTLSAIGGYDDKLAQITAHKVTMGCERVDNLRKAN